MADIQALQNLCNVSSLNQLSLGENDQLEKRSAIGTLFRNIGDFFLSLSHAGRAEIAQRNERIVAAMQNSVNEARSFDVPEKTELVSQLKTLTDSLQQAASACKDAILKEIMDDLHKDKHYKALPDKTKAALDSALSTTAENCPVAEWQGKMAALKTSFLHPTPKNYDIQQGMQIFQQSLSEDFLSPLHQKDIKEGMHINFKKDMERRMIKSFNSENTPPLKESNAPGGDGLSPSEMVTYCKDKLRTIAGPHADKIMPFLSMMTTQAGMDKALIFLPDYAGLSSESNLHLVEAGLTPNGNSHGIDVAQEGGDLIITTRWEQNFSNSFDLKSTVLSHSGTVSMRIDLNAEPTAHTMNVEVSKGHFEERTVYMPKFTIEGGECHFHTDNVTR